MGLLSSLVVIALVFVVALAIAAASSAPHSVQFSEEFLPVDNTPVNITATSNRAIAPSRRLNHFEPLAAAAKTTPGANLAARPVIFAAGLQ